MIVWWSLVPKVSRLWRKLGVTQPLVRVWNNAGLDLNDHVIQSIKISRGSSEPEDGIHTPTAEVAVNTFDEVRSDEKFRIDLTAYATNLISELCGADRDKIRPRFYGRIGRETVTDITTRKRRMTLYAASWDAQLRNIKTKYTPSYNENVASFLIRTAAAPGSGLPSRPEWTRPATGEQYGYVRRTDEEPVTYSEAIDKWAKDIGLYVQTRRDGSNRILTHELRWQWALDRLQTEMPITRSHAVSPATWEQPSADIPKSHRVLWSNTDGDQAGSWGWNVENPNMPVEIHDMSHVRWWTNEFQPKASGRTYQQRNMLTQYRLPSITFDILRLLTSSSHPQRRQAAQLISLEPGDPVFLSGDWHLQLRGIHFAVGIEESITPDGWEITLNLADSREVVGEASPRVPPRTWESAQFQWMNASGTWQ